jgi:glucokinase
MAARNQNAFIVGVDIGGTKIAASLVNNAGEITGVHRTAMICDSGAAAGLNAVCAAIDAALHTAKTKNIYAIGVCAPGPLDPHTGIVINPPNLPCWRSFPLAKEISKRYQLPVKIENDANAAALAEVLWGAAKNLSKVFYLSIGTGIGTGFILDGKIYNGRTGAAPEGGHVSIDYRGPLCACGKRGCVEALVAGPAIAKRAQEKLQSPHAADSQLAKLAGGKISAVTSELVAQARLAGDPLAKEVLLETIELLAVALGNAIDLLEPDIIVIGGGVAAVFLPFFDHLRQRIPRWAINSRSGEIPVVSAYYGADAGIAGAAALFHP